MDIDEITALPDATGDGERPEARSRKGAPRPGPEGRGLRNTDIRFLLPFDWMDLRSQNPR